MALSIDMSMKNFVNKWSVIGQWRLVIPPGQWIFLLCSMSISRSPFHRKPKFLTSQQFSAPNHEDTIGREVRRMSRLGLELPLVCEESKGERGCLDSVQLWLRTGTLARVRTLDLYYYPENKCFLWAEKKGLKDELEPKDCAKTCVWILTSMDHTNAAFIWKMWLDE